MLSDTGTISLRDAILRWIDWRIDIKHRTIAKKLRKLREEKHRLEALIQLRHQKNLDAVFNIIKTSETDEEIIDKLMNKFGFTSYQADLISNMKIKNQKKASIAEYVKQYEEIDSKIAETEELLVSKDKIKEVIWNELEEGKKLFGRPRSCRIIKPESTKPPIFHYRLVVTKKYIKRLARNGVGAGYVDSDDSPIAYFNDITSVDYIHIGTENGYWCYVPIDSIPTCDPSSKGTPLESLIGDKIGNAVVAVKTSLSRIKNNPEQYRLYCFTAKGLIKATPLDKFTVTRKMNTAIIVNEGDRVCFMGVFSNSDNERLLYTKSGYGLIFNLSVVPSTGRATKGQRFIKVGNDDEVLGVSVSKGIKDVLVLTKKGFGKITELDDIFIATKKRQKMIPLTRFNDGDELFDIIPIRDEDVFYESKLEIQMQSGDITEIDTKKIKRASRNSKCFKIAPVRRGDCIIRVKLI
jgi:DNA gyrase subunit A